MGEGSGRGHRIVAHTADVGIEAQAPAPDALLEEAAAALAEVMAEVPPSTGAPGDAEPFSLEGLDLPALAFAWLNELVGLSEVRRAVPIRTEVHELRLDERGEATLSGRAWFSPYATDGPQPRHHVKSVSLHRLRVWSQRGRWRLTAILDL
jgi:SHS2 domain-containing protein